MYDVQIIRRDFPILAREVYGKPLVYLDNAASAQKPKPVLDAITHDGVREALARRVSDWMRARKES